MSIKQNIIVLPLMFVALAFCVTVKADQKTLSGQINAITDRSITVDGQTIFISPKTRIIVDGTQKKLDKEQIGKDVTILYEDSLEVAISVTVGEPASDCSVVKSLQGDWVCIRIEEAGKVMEQKRVASQNRRLMIKRHHATIQFAHLARKQLLNYVGLFDIDASTQAFDFVGRGPRGQLEEWVGIYKLQGDMLTLCYRYQIEGEAERPAEFKSDAQKPNFSALYVFKRVTADE